MTMLRGVDKVADPGDSIYSRVGPENPGCLGLPYCYTESIVGNVSRVFGRCFPSVRRAPPSSG